MPRNLLWIGLLLLTVEATSVAGDEKPAAINRQWVAGQVQLLDADSFAARAQAEKSLLEAGPEILPFLPAPELLPSAAVQQAVRRIRLRLEESQARESVKASTVNIQGKSSVRELLKQISKQTGNPIDASRAPDALLDLVVEQEWNNTSFWQALISLSDDVGFGFERDSSSESQFSSVRLVPREAKIANGKWSTSAAFLIAGEPAQTRPRFGAVDGQLLRVPIRIAAEPRLRPLFLKVNSNDFSLRTDEKTRYAPFSPHAKIEIPLGEGGSDLEFPMDFLVPKPLPAKTVELKGRATVTVAAGSEEIAFTKLPKAEGTARRCGGVTVSLETVRFDDDEKHPGKKKLTLGVVVHYDTGGPAFESHRSWIYHNQVYLEAKDGKRIERSSDFHTALQTDGGVIVEYNFPNLSEDPSDYKFTYIAPTLIINVPVEFAFEELRVK